MFIEPQKEGDPFEVSDADTMLRYLDPQAAKPDQVALLTRPGCAFCARAKQLLGDAGIEFAEIDLPPAVRSQALGAIAGAQTVPQLFVNGTLIGDSEAIERYLQRRRAAWRRPRDAGFSARRRTGHRWRLARHHRHRRKACAVARRSSRAAHERRAPMPSI